MKPPGPMPRQYVTTLKDGPWAGAIMAMVRRYEEIRLPEGMYAWDEKIEGYRWQAGDVKERG